MDFEFICPRKQYTNMTADNTRIYFTTTGDETQLRYNIYHELEEQYKKLELKCRYNCNYKIGEIKHINQYYEPKFNVNEYVITAKKHCLKDEHKYKKQYFYRFYYPSNRT